MNRTVLAATGLGSLATGALAAGWVVALTPNVAGTVPVPAWTMRAAKVSPHVVGPATTQATPDAGTLAPRAAVAACQPAASAYPVREAGAVARVDAPAPVTAPKSIVAEKRSKPAHPIVANVETRVAKAVALFVPASRHAPIVPRVDHRYDGVLTASEIGRIKGALRLSTDQEAYWPAVADLLRTVGRRQTIAVQAGQTRDIDLSGDLMHFYYAAQPLIQSLREDQKIEVRRLARYLGLSSVASYI